MPDWKQSLSIATGLVLGSLVLGVLGSFGLKTGLSRIHSVTGPSARR